MPHYDRPLAFVQTNYAEKTKTDIVAAQTGKQLVFCGGTVNNRSGGANIIGFSFKIDNTRWKAGQWVNAAGTEYTDDTTDAQDAGTNDFALTTTTANDGFAVQALDKFGVVGIQVTTASAGAPVYEVTYWNGTTYATLTTIENATAGFGSTGEKTMAFSPPIDWATVASGSTAALDGFDVDKYVMRVRATTAPSTAPLASLLWVARLYDYKEAVADNTVVNFVPEDSRGLVLQGGESLIPYFQTANADNSVSVRYRIRG